MVPQQLVALAGLPKNANGKTDLRRLREQVIGNASD
jgi:acyl-coenzyme A synthetase/AMP-(fatty) acid ligase